MSTIYFLYVNGSMELVGNLARIMEYCQLQNIREGVILTTDLGRF